MSAVNYDLIVIGSGPSGQRAAVAASKIKKRVAVVEARTFVGGVCVNTGTIPSKTMREAVLHLSGYNYRALYGVNYRVKEKITMADLAFRVQAVIKTEVDVTDSQLSRNGIDVIHGVARFLDPRQVRVEGPQADTTLEADRIIVAVGTRPATSPKVPINGRTIVNSDQVLALPELPRSLIVVGGGVVGVEYTCMFAVLGVRVTLIEKRDRLLEFADREIIEALSYHLRDSRVTLRLGEEVESVEELSDSTVVANLQSQKKVSGDALLYAVGRQGNTTTSTWTPPASKPTSAAASPSASTTKPKSITSTPSATWSAFPLWPRSPWNKGALQPPTPSAASRPQTPTFIPTASTPSPRSASLAKPRNS